MLRGYESWAPAPTAVSVGDSEEDHVQRQHVLALSSAVSAQDSGQTVCRDSDSGDGQPGVILKYSVASKAGAWRQPVRR